MSHQTQSKLLRTHKQFSSAAATLSCCWRRFTTSTSSRQFAPVFWSKEFRISAHQPAQTSQRLQSTQRTTCQSHFRQHSTHFSWRRSTSTLITSIQRPTERTKGRLANSESRSSITWTAIPFWDFARALRCWSTVMPHLWWATRQRVSLSAIKSRKNSQSAPTSASSSIKNFPNFIFALLCFVPIKKKILLK